VRMPGRQSWSKATQDMATHIGHGADAMTTPDDALIGANSDSIPFPTFHHDALAELD